LTSEGEKTNEGGVSWRLMRHFAALNFLLLPSYFSPGLGIAAFMPKAFERKARPRLRLRKPKPGGASPKMQQRNLQPWFFL